MSRWADRASRDDRGGAAANVVIAVMVIAPLVALLWVASYNKRKPELFGFPFFYWYQLLWVLITAALTLVAYLFVRGGDSARAEQRQAERDRGERQ